MWNDGYTSEIDYISEYYSELAPSRLKLALLACGVDHAVPTEPAYLELGFGQGLSLAINAATNSGSYYGTDFNPGQVANARELAHATGKQLKLMEDSFEELAARTDMPAFDIIALHGIWSWISDGSRQALVDILRNWLKPGGVVYASYNVTPGWSPAVPLRTLLHEYGRREATGSIVERVDQSIGFVDKVIGANATYFAKNPALKARLEKIKKQDRSYVAHEYFNSHFHPMPFSEVADRLSEAKLTFAASANLLDNLPGIGIPVAARDVLAEIRDPVLRETTRDYFVSQQFRRDIFVKGPRPISPYELGKRIEQVGFILLGDPDKLPEKVETAAGMAQLREAVYKPVVSALAKCPDYCASVGELLAMKETKSLNRKQIWEALLVLTNARYVGPTSGSATPEADQLAAASLNRELVERAEASASIVSLASAKLGAAIPVSRIEQLFIRAQHLGEKDPAAFVWRVFSAQGMRLLSNSKRLEGDEANLKELKRRLSEFEKSRAPILKRLGVL